MSWEPYFIVIFNFDSLNAAAVKFSVLNCKFVLAHSKDRLVTNNKEVLVPTLSYSNINDEGYFCFLFVFSDLGQPKPYVQFNSESRTELSHAYENLSAFQLFIFTAKE